MYYCLRKILGVLFVQHFDNVVTESPIARFMFLIYH